MFDFLKSIRSVVGGGGYLGLDIGTTSIKVAELERGSGKPVLKNYGELESSGHLDRTNVAIHTSNLKMMDKDVIGLLELLMKQLKIRSRTAIASLPSFLSFTTLLEIPAMSPKEVSQAIYYQARAFVPIPLQEVTIDWITVGEYEDERGVKKQQIFLVSVPNEEIKRYQRILGAVGLNLQALEVEGFSLARALTRQEQGDVLIVDIGGRSTAISVASKGLLKFNVQSDFAGSSLSQAISSGLNINIRRAEELKRQRGLVGTGGEYELSTLMAPFLDVILGEVKRVKYNYETNYKGKIEKIILSGGGANLKGIEDYIKREFDLPTIKANPFSGIDYPPNVAPLINEIGPPFSVSIGLAMKNLI